MTPEDLEELTRITLALLSRVQALEERLGISADVPPLEAQHRAFVARLRAEE